MFSQGSTEFPCRKSLSPVLSWSYNADKTAHIADGGVCIEKRNVSDTGSGFLVSRNVSGQYRARLTPSLNMLLAS